MLILSAFRSGTDPPYPAAGYSGGMPKTNVEIVREGFDAFNRRDVDRLVSLCSPDTEWLPFRAQLEGVPYRGHEGVRQFVADMDADWEAFRIDPVDLRERDERVVAIGQVTGRGAESGVSIDLVGGFVFELHDGRITGLTSYSNASDALAAVGLTE
jgi:steroid delta-isomerase-like uncharacterized protein